MQRWVLGIALAGALAAPVTATAEDVWDITSAGDDDGPGTDTELAPGTVQVHDMEAVGGLEDEDWFLISQQPYSSYEVLVDGLTEGLAFIQPGQTPVPLGVELVLSDGSLMNGSIGLGGIGSARVLHFQNLFGVEIINQFVRVYAPTCATTCSGAEQYKIHLYDTTCMIPRYNNSATQVSVLVLQNASNAIDVIAAHFFDAAGTKLATQIMAIPPFGTYVVTTSAIPGLAGTSGSVVVTHSGRHGALSGKMVALEPGTGYTFDTPLLPRPQ